MCEEEKKWRENASEEAYKSDWSAQSTYLSMDVLLT
jgi:hypothetical protein